MDYFHLNVDREQLVANDSGPAHLVGDSVFEVMVRSWIASARQGKAQGSAPGHRGLCLRPGPGRRYG